MIALSAVNYGEGAVGSSEVAELFSSGFGFDFVVGAAFDVLGFELRVWLRRV